GQGCSSGVFGTALAQEADGGGRQHHQSSSDPGRGHAAPHQRAGNGQRVRPARSAGARPTHRSASGLARRPRARLSGRRLRAGRLGPVRSGTLVGEASRPAGRGLQHRDGPAAEPAYRPAAVHRHHHHGFSKKRRHHEQGLAAAGRFGRRLADVPTQRLQRESRHAATQVRRLLPGHYGESPRGNCRGELFLESQGSPGALVPAHGRGTGHARGPRLGLLRRGVARARAAAAPLRLQARRRSSAG
ncbi:unnamed protein product, partial [Ixodes hexagonus]